MAKTVLNVPDISCEHCQHAIEGALRDAPGINAVHVDIAAKTVALDYDPSTVTLETVGQILDDEGYPVAGAVPVG